VVVSMAAMLSSNLTNKQRSRNFSSSLRLRDNSNFQWTVGVPATHFSTNSRPVKRTFQLPFCAQRKIDTNDLAHDDM
jgi:hypothetical protein